MHTEERQYQLEVKGLLEVKFREVTNQWYPLRGNSRRIYSPAIDVAVGPFVIDSSHGDRYTELLERNRRFIKKLIEKHNSNVSAVVDSNSQNVTLGNIKHFNENARCFLCIEIEKSGSKKHCIGDLVNVSALGRVGLLVAWSSKILRTFLRQRVYLEYLESVGKNTFKTKNALVLSKEQFDECLAEMGR